MRWLARFTFEREAHWLLWIAVLLPLIGFILSIVIPRLLR
jgi:hypothetical protein